MSLHAPPGSSLARARVRAHSAFDPIWQRGEMTRTQAYAWLAEQLGVPTAKCHMLLFDIKTCNRVVEICQLRDMPDLP